MTDIDVARSPGSTVVASELDDQHLDPAESMTSMRNTPVASSKRANGSAAHFSDDEDVKTPSNSTNAAAAPAASTTRGKKGGAAKEPNPSSGYGATKIKHLKKEDGEPLWRVDIQHDFLKTIFEDKKAVFTNSYVPDGPKQTFAEIYIDAMARSSKTSKILRDKLYQDHEQAKNMAMVCLLVNIGRMNTTLNFFPEMRAQLRTYHAIPSLQAHQDRDSYKQLQDAPRLKSILKGASEDRPEPTSLEKIKAAEVPRTNPVNLIFILTQSAQRVTEMHFQQPYEFHDLIMKHQLKSETRAIAFLWLMWFYLESDFTEEGANENPFGPGQDYKQGASNQGVPQLIELTDEELALENVDPPEELEYGKQKMIERKRIIEQDQATLQLEYGSSKRGGKSKLNLTQEDSPSLAARIRPSKYESDIDSQRSTPPRHVGKLRMVGAGRGRALKHQVDNSSPAPPGYSHIILQAQEGTTRRTRPLTAHQLAVEQNRNERINWILGKGLRKRYHQSRKLRRQEGAVVRALNRIKDITDPFEDSEGEEALSKTPQKFYERGFGGLVQCNREDDEFGEEFNWYAAAFRRVGRRLERWDPPKRTEFQAAAAAAAPPPAVNGNGTRHAEETEDDTVVVAKPRATKRGGRKKAAPAPVVTAQTEEEDLDDMDKEILGLASENEDEDLDDVDKELLGMQGGDSDDATEDDAMDID